MRLIFLLYLFMTSPVGSVGWGVHTTLRKLHQIFWLRKPSCQTWQNKTNSILQHSYLHFSEALKSATTVKEKLTKLISLSSNLGSYVCWNLSDVGEWWVYESLVKVLLAHLWSQSLSCCIIYNYISINLKWHHRITKLKFMFKWFVLCTYRQPEAGHHALEWSQTLSNRDRNQEICMHCWPDEQKTKMSELDLISDVTFF